MADAHDQDSLHTNHWRTCNPIPIYTHMFSII